MSNQTTVTKDFEAKKVTVSREFAAPVDLVWRAYTESDLLDQWWAPKPWKAKTKSMDFTEGGQWVYAMVGPEGETHWSVVKYGKINIQKDFTATDAFSDEDGNINNEMPQGNWHNTFEQTEAGTLVTSVLSFETENQMQQLIDMGFEEGIAMGQTNLDELLAKGF